ncbi:MAG: tetratricopeptide repeat protein [Acidobacteria bacterium]|nr:tetratricopeptide repeat protein [Acidobacteriota bacterium]
MIFLLATVARAAPPADKAFESVQSAMQSNQFAQARSLAQEFSLKFGSDPRVPSVLLLKGLAESKDGNENAARMTWNWLLANHPRSEAAASALEQLALSYEHQNQKQQQDDCLRRLLQGFPNHPITINLFIREAQAKLAARDYAAAAALYQKVEAALGEEDREKFKFAQSMASASRIDPKLLLRAANQRLEKNDVAQAISFYQEYLSRFPDDQGANEAKTNLGWCHGLQDQNDKAERLWQSVIKHGPANDPWVGESQWYMVRLLAGPKGKWEDAVKLCEVIVKNFPRGSLRHEQALFTKAWLFWAHKQWSPARAAFADLIAVYPEKANHPPIMEYVADCDKNLSANLGRGR